MENPWIREADSYYGDDAPEGECPTCGGVTFNGEKDSDEGRRCWSWLDCETCKEACWECGQTNVQKLDGEGCCVDCADEKFEGTVREVGAVKSALKIAEYKLKAKDKHIQILQSAIDELRASL